jgi:hypothetical protein
VVFAEETPFLTRKTRFARERLRKDLVPTTKRPIGDFKGALNLRHWLAHGRYWNPKLGRTYSPGDVYDISADLLQALDLL